MNEPNGHIAENHYGFNNGTSHVVFLYLGYSHEHWLTWQQLSWTLAGVLRFVDEDVSHCRTFQAEIDIMGIRSQVVTRFGALIMWYAGDEHGLINEA